MNTMVAASSVDAAWWRGGVKKINKSLATAGAREI